METLTNARNIMNINNEFEQPPPASYLLNGECNSVYYGVHIPPDVQVQDNDGYINVFEDKIEALKVVKKYKKARFKAFAYYHEAAEFAVQGSECPNNNLTVEGGFLQKPVQENGGSAVGEKPSQFRGPTSQNLVKLRKGIENGDFHFVQTTIWDNPRYLIGNGDTPSILQEGFRYNGLHVAAKTKNHEMCELILNTISNVTFIKKLYVDDRNPEERAKILLDLYLNTPDKGLHETPLHFAVKFGAAKCVEVLTSYPQCDKNLRNKHGKYVNQIICERYDGPNRAALVESITNSLQDNFYVPVLRAEDNCAPPIIGAPFSPLSPPNFNKDPLSPRLEIHAYAGPMNKEGAEKFRKLWKTPPRTLNFTSPIKNRSMDSLALLKMKDHEKGLERVGNNLAQQMEVGWKEYWPFLDAFIDISSTDGLEMLENFLAKKVENLYKISPMPSMQNSPKELSLSPKNSPKSAGTEVSPMTDLCRAFQACTLKDNGKCFSNSFEMNKDNDLCPFFYIDKSLQVFAKRISNDIIYLLDVQYDTCTVLEMQIKQLQLLMASYMQDSRFITIDFHLVHARLAYLVKSILKHVLQDFNLLDKMLDLWQEFCSKNYDCFSSDDEGVQNSVVHSKNQHTLCILKHTQEYLASGAVFEEAKTEEDCVKIWKQLKPCGCAWQGNVVKKGPGHKRSNSFKFSSKNAFKIENISRKLSFEDDPDVFKSKPNLVLNNENNRTDNDGDLNSTDEESDDEDFFTPPSTPSLLEDRSEDEEDVYDETHLPETEVYIEGDFPTKIDSAVFNALSYANCKLDSSLFPNVYRWHHAVSLYNESERAGWTSPNVIKCNIGSPQVMSTPLKSTLKVENGTTTPPYTSSKSWLRITGFNSPRASLKSQKCNVSFNL